MVIDRKVDPGQTVASQFQTPEMFKVAPDMEKRITSSPRSTRPTSACIRRRKQRGKPVMFTVDAYPADLFQGKIYQVRLNPTTTQNVVTYPVIVEPPNAELKLLPGMTANLSFQIDKHDNVLRVPNAAMRFYPKPEQVRPEDRERAGGRRPRCRTTTTGRPRASPPQPSAMERAEAGRKRNRRHVWIVDGELLRAVEIVTGLSDNKYSGGLVERSVGSRAGQRVGFGMLRIANQWCVCHTFACCKHAPSCGDTPDCREACAALTLLASPCGPWERTSCGPG